jgi:hypothetical protein
MRLGIALVAEQAVRLCEEQLNAGCVVWRPHLVVGRCGSLQRSERS